MTIYIDPEYKCHVAPAEGLREIETSAFDGKCQTFIEGYRYVPEGEEWTRSDGNVFRGELISPWIPYQLLAAVQAAYEEGQTTGTGGIDKLVTAAGNAYTEGVNSI